MNRSGKCEGPSGGDRRGALCIGLTLVLYIKANMVSICVDKNWAVPGRFFQSLLVPYGAGDKQGRAGGGQGKAARAIAAGGHARCHFY